MGFQLSKAEAAQMFSALTERFDIFAPVLMVGEGTFSDIDVVRYAKVTSPEEVEWEKKSDYSFKETLLAINETIFYFTEDQTIVPKGPEKDLLILLRSCDLAAVKRLDQIYLDNVFGDFYYERIRSRAKFILMNCNTTCESGFCVSMGTNASENYDAYIRCEGDQYFLDIKDTDLAVYAIGSETEVRPAYITENKQKVTLPKGLKASDKNLPIWKEYGDRCITCGRCNFACPTCTCFTMQDIFYKDNPKAGERRRVWASCQIDGYTDIAGGHGFRGDKGERMRFKVMHKIYDFEKRFGYPMCVGCGRCDDICPEYISYSNLVNRLADMTAKEEQ